LPDKITHLDFMKYVANFNIDEYVVDLKDNKIKVVESLQSKSNDKSESTSELHYANSSSEDENIKNI